MQTKGQPKARRDSKTGKQYYPVKVFSGVDKKNVSVPKEEVLKVFKKLPETVEELQSCRKIFKERYQTKRTFWEDSLSWEKDYSTYSRLHEEFTTFYSKDKDPRTATEYPRLLKFYVFRFFLEVKKEKDLLRWIDFYEDFRDWIDEQPGVRHKDRLLSVSTKYKIVCSLNMFTRFARKKRIIEKAIDPMENYKKGDVKRRSLKDTFLYDEVITISKSLFNNFENKAYFDSFYTNFFLGLRFGELRALSIDNVVQGSHPDFEDFQNYKNPFTKKPFKIFGFLMFSYQDKNSRLKNPLNEQGDIEPKKLKWRKDTSDENMRIVPIWDFQCWKIIARRYNEQSKLFQEKGGSKKNYLLFGDLYYSEALAEIQNHIEEHFPKWRKNGVYHNLRHAAITYTVMANVPYNLVKYQFGNSFREYERYSHAAALLAKQLQKLTTPDLILVDESSSDDEMVFA
ncbi:hypothetical protein [uncultured Mediterranean phage uvMED]|nr:hypothetical protein [uncultured Mediterranean phage uvMED]